MTMVQTSRENSREDLNREKSKTVESRFMLIVASKCFRWNYECMNQMQFKNINKPNNYDKYSKVTKYTYYTIMCNV